ncbi:unnamed protein product [Ambrosiozyma monospora]|uniref:Unnamed protein product n=1 Tax=Ambrosiozyma monospora TaxID=43982 RepID=A0ACB5TSG0_AMBMO|nr:unnamed protein product [Ambrosiozyma monospora]
MPTTSSSSHILPTTSSSHSLPATASSSSLLPTTTSSSSISSSTTTPSSSTTPKTLSSSILSSPTSILSTPTPTTLISSTHPPTTYSSSSITQPTTTSSNASSSIPSSSTSSALASSVSSVTSSDSSSVVSSKTSSSISSDASTGSSSYLAQVTGKPEITVDVSYNGVIDLIHLTGLNDNLQYEEGAETFYANGGVWTNTDIVVVDGKFDATAVLGSHLDDISFVATADNSGKTAYPVTVSAEITYEAVATPFYPLETGVAEKKKLIKRAGGGSRTFTATNYRTIYYP